MRVQVDRVPFGADVTVTVRRLDDGTEKDADWFQVAALAHLLAEAYDDGLDVVAIAQDVADGKVGRIVE